MKRRPQRTYTKPYKKQKRSKTIPAFFVVLAMLAGVCTVIVMRNADYGMARSEYMEYQDQALSGLAAGQEPTKTLAQAPDEGQADAAQATATQSDSASVAIPTDTAQIGDPFYSEMVARLKKNNSDAVGWLDIVDTKMNYPIVKGNDNAYYTAHTFNKKKSASGAIFIDCWNQPNFSDFNTVIYGHNMKDGSMFHDLREYKHQRFFDDHPYIEITLENKKLRYQVFAAYSFKMDSKWDFRGQNCFTDLERSEFIKAARKRSTGIASSQTVSRNDRMLTLATCDGDTNAWYWVVHAVLIEERTTI